MKAKLMQAKYQLEIMKKKTIFIGNIEVNELQWKQAIEFLEGKTNEVSPEVLEIIEELMKDDKKEEQKTFDHGAYVERTPKTTFSRQQNENVWSFSRPQAETLTTIEEARKFNIENNITNRTAEETLIIQAKNNQTRRLFRLFVEMTSTGFEITKVIWGVPSQDTKLSWKIACMVEKGITRNEFNELKEALYYRQ